MDRTIVEADGTKVWMCGDYVYWIEPDGVKGWCYKDEWIDEEHRDAVLASDIKGD